MEKKKLKKMLQVILFNLIVLLLIFFTFEIFLRGFSSPIYGFQEGVFVYDEATGYRLSTNYSGVQSIYGKNYLIEINEKGLRDSRDYPYKKQDHVYRIVVLGDSFSFGNGVELNESYVEYLRENFNEDNVEIINLGVPGYGVNNQYVYFLEEGLKYDPDIVMIQYCTNDWGTHSINTKDNKIIVDYNNSFVADENGFLIDYLSNSPIRSIHLFMLRNLRSYSFIYTKSRNSLSRVVKVLRGGSDVPPPFLRERDSLEYQENYEGYYKLLSSLKDNADAEVVIFAGPQPEDIWDKEKIKSQFDMKIVPDIRQTQKDLEYASEELNLYFINLESYDEDIFIEIDGHWNAKGNKLVADTLYDELNGILF